MYQQKYVRSETQALGAAAAVQLKMHTSTTTSPPPILLTAEAARPCCWPCKSKRTQNRTTVSDETTTFFAALLHTYNCYIRRCRTSSSILWCTQAAVGESVLTRNVVILIYVDSITITPVSEHSELEIIKKWWNVYFAVLLQQLIVFEFLIWNISAGGKILFYVFMSWKSESLQVQFLNFGTLC